MTAFAPQPIEPMPEDFEHSKDWFLTLLDQIEHHINWNSDEDDYDAGGIAAIGLVREKLKEAKFLPPSKAEGA